MPKIWSTTKQHPPPDRDWCLDTGKECPVAVLTSWSWSKACFQLEWCVDWGKFEALWRGNARIWQSAGYFQDAMRSWWTLFLLSHMLFLPTDVRFPWNMLQFNFPPIGQQCFYIVGGSKGIGGFICPTLSLDWLDWWFSESLICWEVWVGVEWRQVLVSFPALNEQVWAKDVFNAQLILQVEPRSGNGPSKVYPPEIEAS